MLVEPTTENAVKFERFIFDVLPSAERSLVVEARREDEFCPLKNQSGDFSAAHVQQSLSRLHANWLRSAGIAIGSNCSVEISPLFALDSEQLAQKIDRSRPYAPPLYLE
jgi:UDP-N-acetylglucosamine/UDP-N-acetylgalactosamine diphosphorylase